MCARGVFVGLDLSLGPWGITMLSSLRDFVSCAGIRYHVSVPMISLMTSLILARLDYCNSVLFRRLDVIVSRLQSFQNAAARVIFVLRRTVHVIDILICLHWLAAGA